MLTSAQITKIFSKLGEDVSYTAVGGSPKTIKAIITNRIAMEKEYPDGAGTLTTADSRILSNATTGVAAPVVGDSFTAFSKTWRVVGVSVCGNYEWLLSVESFVHRRAAQQGSEVTR
jgi:hypothetical protein